MDQRRPLVSYHVIVDLISASITEAGLTVGCELDSKAYSKGVVFCDAEMASLAILRNAFHSDWNCTIHPFPTRNQSG